MLRASEMGRESTKRPIVKEAGCEDLVWRWERADDEFGFK